MRLHQRQSEGSIFFMDLKLEIGFSSYHTSMSIYEHWCYCIYYTKQMFHLIARLSVRSACSPTCMFCRSTRERKNFLSGWWWSSNKFMCSLWGISMLIYYRRRSLAAGWEAVSFPEVENQKWESYVPALTRPGKGGVCGVVRHCISPLCRGLSSQGDLYTFTKCGSFVNKP